jgi:hypothetical protein
MLGGIEWEVQPECSYRRRTVTPKWIGVQQHMFAYNCLFYFVVTTTFTNTAIQHFSIVTSTFADCVEPSQDLGIELPIDSRAWKKVQEYQCV